jgi:hypothetical protein
MKYGKLAFDLAICLESACLGSPIGGLCQGLLCVYFFKKDLLTKAPPHPESRRTLMRLKSLPVRPPLRLYIHPSVMEDKFLVSV